MLGLALVTCAGRNYWCPSREIHVTVQECLDLELIPYKLLMQCGKGYIPNTTSGFGPNENGEYTCPTGSYTTFVGSTIGCVESWKDCGTMYVVYDPYWRVCTTNPYFCNYFALIAYNWTGKNECISEAQC